MSIERNINFLHLFCIRNAFFAFMSVFFILHSGQASAKEYWAKFAAVNNAGQNIQDYQIAAAIHGGSVLFKQLDSDTVINLSQSSTSAWVNSNLGIYPSELITQTTQLVRAPKSTVTLLDPTEMMIIFDAPVLDPIVAFYSLDNTGVTAKNNFTTDGAAAEVTITSSDPSMIDSTNVAVSGPSASGTRLAEGCRTGSNRVCGTFQFKGVYAQLKIGQFSITSAADGVGFEVGIAVIPQPSSDAGAVTFGVGGIAVNDVRSNDVIKGLVGSSLPADAVNTVVSPVGTWFSGISLDPATGKVSVDASVPVGEYTVDYQLCDAKDASNCVTASVVITVKAPVVVPPPVVEPAPSPVPAWGWLSGLVSLLMALWMGRRQQRLQQS